jgi:hypothetical protein
VLCVVTMLRGPLVRKSIRTLLAGAVLVTGLVAVQPSAEASTVYCKSTANPKMAAKLQHDIANAMSQYSTTKGIGVYDAKHHLYCLVNAHWHNFAASSIKATILAALLYKRHGHLTTGEKDQAYKMIHASNNQAAINLWSDVGGYPGIKPFLNAAGMNETLESPTGSWGGTLETAYDELKLLRLLTASNKVLSNASRSYELGLMAGVEQAQRFGTPAGHPVGVQVHVKNGWYPWGNGWVVNSLGTFNGGSQHADYMMDVLTAPNGTGEQYGINSIQAIARVVHRDLNPGASLTAREAAPVYPTTSDGSTP